MRSIAAAVLVLAALASGACRPPTEPPVARLAAEPAETRLLYPQHAAIELAWDIRRSLEPFVDRPVVFLHLVDQRGEVVRTFDHPFPEPWRPGRAIAYPVVLTQSALGPALPAGDYALVAGLYDGAEHRWPLETEAGAYRRLEYRVGTVSVPDVAAEPARFEFSGGWFPIDAGTDRQVLARRWLYGSGSLLFRGGPAGASVRIVLGIPEGRAYGETIRVREGRGEAAVYIHSECSSKEWAGAGAGLHEAELPLDLADPEGPACVIAIEPNFYLEPEGLSPPRSVVLESLSWRPLEGAEEPESPAP